jgi:hypothetical protein
MKIGLSVSSTRFDFKIAQDFAVKSLALACKPSGSNPNETMKTDASGEGGSLEHRTILGAGGIGAEIWLVVLGAGGGLLLIGARYLTGVLVFSIVLERSHCWLVVCTGWLVRRLRWQASAGSSPALANLMKTMMIQSSRRGAVRGAAPAEWGAVVGTTCKAEP